MILEITSLYIIGSPKVTEVPLLYFFIPTPASSMASVGGTSGNNSDFSINAKSDAISGNEDFMHIKI